MDGLGPRKWDSLINTFVDVLGGFYFSDLGLLTHSAVLRSTSIMEEVPLNELNLRNHSL